MANKMNSLSLMNYKVRYKELKATQIFNFLGPWANTHDLPYGSRLVKAQEVIDKRNKIDGFFDRLEEDVLKNGIVDPVVINSGWFPDTYWARFPKEVIIRGMEKVDGCISIGGSRLWIAQKHKLTVPCLINDFSNKYDGCPLIMNEKDVEKYYSSKPSSIVFSDQGLIVTAEKGTVWEFKEPEEIKQKRKPRKRKAT